MDRSGRDDLPLSDYDQLPMGSLESRIRSLTSDQVEKLLDHEKAHGHRVPATQVLSARLDQLRNGAEPTGGDPSGHRPETGATPGGSPVSPRTQAQPYNPPPHGTPDQRGKPKGDRF
jgi:hypothetical protein